MYRDSLGILNLEDLVKDLTIFHLFVVIVTLDLHFLDVVAAVDVRRALTRILNLFDKALPPHQQLGQLLMTANTL